MATLAKPSGSLTLDKLLGLYSQMAIMRLFEVQLLEQSKSGNLRGSLHLATGQEALPAGTCLALEKEDAITMTYRGHGYALAKGSPIPRIAAEILGRVDGLCRGKGGKMHLFDPEFGILGANGIVAGGIPTALGAALASQKLKKSTVAVTVFGDGALNQGVAMESLNLAALWHLPVIFLCENNLYAEMTPLDRSSAQIELIERAKSFGIMVDKIDGNNVLDVYDAVSNARAHCLAGRGPVFIEAMTYRTCGHYQLDPGTSYRSKEEVAKWERNSPIKRFSDYLIQAKLTTETTLMNLDKEAETLIRDAFAFAEASPSPTAEEAYKGVFV